MRATDWRLGGAPHPATKTSPDISSYFPLVKNYLGPDLQGDPVTIPCPHPLFPWVCVRRLGLYNTYGKKIAVDSPPIFHS